MYDDRYNGWYDDYDEDAYEDYGYDDGYEDYDEYEDYDDYDQFAEDWTQDRGGWEDLIDGPLWPGRGGPLGRSPAGPADGRMKGGGADETTQTADDHRPGAGPGRWPPGCCSFASS